MEAFENWAKRCAARGDIHCTRTLQRTGYDIRPRCMEASVPVPAITNGQSRLVEEPTWNSLAKTLTSWMPKAMRWQWAWGGVEVSA